MTDEELINEADMLATASRAVLVGLHHRKYPAERNSIRGAYNPSRSKLLADLIVDLAQRYKDGK